MVSVAAAISSETHGLNHLPRLLHPHGTAIINTLTPTAGALGAAFFVGLTSIGENLSVETNERLAMLEGFQLSLGAMSLLSLIALFYAMKVTSGRMNTNDPSP